MASVSTTITDDELRRRLAGLEESAEKPEALLRELGEYGLSSVQQNFNEGGRPRWDKLADATIRRKGHAKPLQGRTSNLRNISLHVFADHAELRTHPSARAYAAIQNYGGVIHHPGGTHFFIKAGELIFVNKKVGEARHMAKTKPHNITIPARPYMVLQPEDIEEMRALIRAYYARQAQ